MKTLVVAETQSGRLRGTSSATIRLAQELAQGTGGSWSAVILGAESSNDAVERVSSFGPAKVYSIIGDAFANHLAGPCTAALSKLVEQEGFDTVVTTSSTTGRDFMPRLAARLAAGMVTGVCGWEQRDSKLVFRRKVFSGGVVEVMKVDSSKLVMTVDATEFGDPEPGTKSEAVAFDPGDLGDAYRARFVELRAEQRDRPDLAEAEVVVSFGRGVKDPANIVNVEKLADALGAALGGTRAVVDSGWMANDLQVGQTGKQVAPKLYFALGLSGSIQHVAGIRGSKKIVAINKDPEAPIFQVADIGLVADMQVAVPQMLELIGG